MGEGEGLTLELGAAYQSDRASRLKRLLVRGWVEGWR